MSIIIPGMKMPKDGECVVVFADGVVQKYKAGGIAFFEYQDRLEETVAVQLPPHGRLGDLDALVKKSYEIKSCVGRYSRVVHIEDVKNADTIIPADPGKEDI